MNHTYFTISYCQDIIISRKIKNSIYIGVSKKAPASFETPAYLLILINHDNNRYSATLGGILYEVGYNHYRILQYHFYILFP